MISLMAGVLTARWFPYVVIGSLIGAGLVFGYGFMKGYGKAEEVYMTEMNRSLQAQQERLLARAALELELAVDNAERRYDIQESINRVIPPTNNCELHPDCVRWYDDIVRASKAGRLRLDAPAPGGGDR